MNNGMPISIAKEINVPLAHKCYTYAAGYVDKITGSTIPIHGPYQLSTIKEPVGVVAQIIPWNLPLVKQAYRLAPALAAGCTVVMKTAEDTPLSALRVAELIN
jgi:aldehyde dehydrogenase (NAD+)